MDKENTERLLTRLRVPTNEQYAYIEVEFLGTTDEALAEYRRLVHEVNNERGLSVKDFNEVLDTYLSDKPVTNGTESWAAMSTFQKAVFNEIKKSKARLTK